MTFKKNKIKKSSPVYLNIVGIISLILIFLLWFFLLKNISFFNFNEIITIQNIDNSWEKKNEVQIKNQKVKDYIKNKNSSKKINILIVWRWWWDHDAPNLTDTIILASIDTKKHIINILSIPRDLYVQYPSKQKIYTSSWYILKENKWKINWLYATYSFKNNSKKEWMKVLKNKITQITWEKIDYFINIDFNWFEKIIDTIWWIQITIPKQFVDNRYPDWNWWYRTLIFKKWTWLFDWENTLKYVRSRHSTSDFDRSIRQQQVIKAIKDKLIWSYFFKSPWKIKELYDVFTKYVYTDLKLSTLIKLSYTLNSNDYKIISSNINDSCFYWSDTCSKWWFLYAPQRSLFWWMSVLLLNWTDKDDLNNYSKIQKYTNIVFNYPEIYKENYKINIFNSIKVNNLAWLLSNDIVRYGFNIPQYNSIWNTKKTYTKSVVYYNNIDKNSKTIELLKQFITAKFIQTDFPKYSKDNAQIEIIIWEDYLSDKKPFNF